MDIKQLRDKFFRECCAKQEDGLQDVNMTPHNTFEWFVKHLYENKREYISAQILAGIMTNCTHEEEHLHYAVQAVAYADALLEALSKK
jgi:hypothetical protein